MDIKVSVITVTYNAGKFIEPTLKSVLAQTLPGIEHIIIDGLSRDNTLEIIRRYYPEGEGVNWVSEKDFGIYDAMNKAHEMAQGRYLMYLNAGDILESDDTLEKALLAGDNSDFIYGDTRIIDTSFKEVGMRHFVPPAHLTWKSFRKGMVVCHQSILVKKEVTQDYDTQYKIAADIDWAIRTIKVAKTNKNAGIIITRFMEDGISTTRRKEGVRERFAVMKKHYGIFTTLWNNFTRLLDYVFSGRMFRNVR